MNISPVNNYYNISFARKKIPVYVIDSKGNYRRFNSRAEAAKAVGTSAPEVNRSAEKRFHRAKGYFIVNASEIEKQNENGEIVVCQKDIDELVAYRTLDREIYALDEQGNYLKFPSQLDASKELGIDRRAISSIISDTGRRSTKGYFFAPASKIESKDAQGRTYVDREKINTVINKDKYSHPIYAIDKKGNYRKFSNQAQIAQELGVSRQRINQVIISNDACCGYYFVPADILELQDEDNKTLIDNAKLQEILVKKSLMQKEKHRGKIKEIYAIDSKCNYKKFNSRKEASEFFDIPISTISNIVAGYQRKSHELTFVNASQIEKLNEDGEVVVDNEKLKEILKERFPKTIFLEN